MTNRQDGSGGEGHASQDAGRKIVDLGEYRQARDPAPVTFHRLELNAILRVYGRMVGEGEWRDYSIDFLADRAVFAVYKRSGDLPLYRIEKNPKLANRQGAFAVVATNGRIIKRGHELAQVLKFFDKVQSLSD